MQQSCIVVKKTLLFAAFSTTVSEAFRNLCVIFQILRNYIFLALVFRNMLHFWGHDFKLVLYWSSSIFQWPTEVKNDSWELYKSIFVAKKVNSKPGHSIKNCLCGFSKKKPFLIDKLLRLVFDRKCENLYFHPWEVVKSFLNQSTNSCSRTQK